MDLRKEFPEVCQEISQAWLLLCQGPIHENGLFRSQMEEQGWDESTIHIIDKDSQKVLEDKGRSREEIYATTADVWRHVQGRDVDETIADKYHPSEYGQTQQWRRAKAQRGIIGTVTSGSSASSSQRWSSSSSSWWQNVKSWWEDK